MGDFTNEDIEYEMLLNAVCKLLAVDKETFINVIRRATPFFSKILEQYEFECAPNLMVGKTVQKYKGLCPHCECVHAGECTGPCHWVQQDD